MAHRRTRARWISSAERPRVIPPHPSCVFRGKSDSSPNQVGHRSVSIRTGFHELSGHIFSTGQTKSTTPNRPTQPSGKCIPQRRRAAENPNPSSQRLRRSARDSFQFPRFALFSNWTTLTPSGQRLPSPRQTGQSAHFKAIHLCQRRCAPPVHRAAPERMESVLTFCVPGAGRTLQKVTGLTPSREIGQRPPTHAIPYANGVMPYSPGLCGLPHYPGSMPHCIPYPEWGCAVARPGGGSSQKAILADTPCGTTENTTLRFPFRNQP